MMEKGCTGCMFLFGAFLIVFTFVAWNPAQWVAFGIGIVLVLHSVSGCCKKGCCGTKVAKAPAKKKK